MENEEVFQADAELNGLEYTDSRSSRRSTQKGHDPVKAALGGLEAERDIHDEDTPLLVSNREDSSQRGASETSGPPKWDREGDFEGRPWWNKPSVRNP